MILVDQNEARKNYATGERHGMYQHGHSVGSKASPTYESWQGMIKRCTNKNYREWHLYGGRGITVCDRWRLFVNFLEDMGEKPPGLSIDRINNDGNYEPGNCKWSTPKEQANNRRVKIRTECARGHSLPNGGRCGLCRALSQRIRRDSTKITKQTRIVQ